MRCAGQHRLRQLRDPHRQCRRQASVAALERQLIANARNKRAGVVDSDDPNAQGHSANVDREEQQVYGTCWCGSRGGFRAMFTSERVLG